VVLHSSMERFSFGLETQPSGRGVSYQTTITDSIGSALALFLPLIAVAWLLVPPTLVYGSLITSAPFFGETPSAADQAEATALLRAAAATAVGLPLAGLLLSRSLRRRGAAWMFGIAMTVSMLAALLVFADDLESVQREPQPRVRTCQEHSGGDATCPGG
jgi:hypothetical protein